MKILNRVIDCPFEPKPTIRLKTNVNTKVNIIDPPFSIPITCAYPIGNAS